MISFSEKDSLFKMEIQGSELPDENELHRLKLKISVARDKHSHQINHIDMFTVELRPLKEFFEKMILTESPEADSMDFFESQLIFKYKKLATGMIELSILIGRKYFPEDWPYINGENLAMNMQYILDADQVKETIRQLDFWIADYAHL